MLRWLPVLLLVVASASMTQAQSSKVPVPPTLPCGSLSEHGVVIATSDVPQSFPDKRYTSDDAHPLSDGVTNLPPLASSYPFNGGGHADLQDVTANCQQILSQVTVAEISVHVNAKLSAHAGHCCSGFNPGGVVNFSPEWASTFVLPGTPASNRWNIQLAFSVAKIGAHARCQWLMDGIKQADLPISTGSKASALSVLPGNHTMDISCTADDFHVDARPGNVGWEHDASGQDSISLTWVVVKTQ